MGFSSLDSPNRRKQKRGQEVAAAIVTSSVASAQVPTAVAAAKEAAAIVPTQTSRAPAARASASVSSVAASVGSKTATDPWWKKIFRFRPKSTIAASPEATSQSLTQTPRTATPATAPKRKKSVEFNRVEVEPIPLLESYRNPTRVGTRRIDDITLEDRNTRESTNRKKRIVSPSTTPNDELSKAAETHKDFAIGEAAEKIYKDGLRKKAKKCDLSPLNEFTDAELKSYLNRMFRIAINDDAEKMQLGIIAERLGKMQEYDRVAMPWDLAKAQTAEAEEKTRADLFVADVAPSRSKAAKTSTTPRSAFKPGKNKSDYGIAADAARRAGVIQTRSATPAATATPALTTERTSSERTVIQDYWYTNAHIEDIGAQWQKAGANRLFIPISLPGAFEEELTYKTGLTQQNVNALRGPCKIMLPLNKGGNHWTAITADVTIGANGRKIVKLSFTDSLGAEREYNKLPQRIKAEMDRIGNLFRGADVTKEIYAYTWKQPDGDGSSCGPYSIANAVRCLDGKNAERSPGREVIRRQQLDVMTNNSAIRSCSTNNKVDEVIRSWVIDRVSKNLPYAIENQNDFLEMCQNFANYSKTDREKIRMIFVTENNRMDYDNIDLVLPYVRKRMGELIASDELLQEAQVGKVRRRSVVLPASVQQAPTIRPLDVIAPFEDMRKELKKELGRKDSYRFVGKIMQDLALIGTDDEALTRVATRISKLEDQALAERCLKVVAIVSKGYETVRSKEKYVAKLADQAETYLETYKAIKRKDLLVEPIKALIEKGRVKPEELKKLGISENPSERKITTKQAVDFWHARKHKESFAEVAKVYADALRAEPELRHLPPKQKQRKGNKRKGNNR